MVGVTLLIRLPTLLFVIASTCDDGGWSTKDDDRVAVSKHCNLERRNAQHVTQSEFELRYAFTQPVLIFNTHNELFRERTAKQQMLQIWANKPVVLNSANTYSYQRIPSTFSDYVNNYLRAQNVVSLANETLYLFGDIDSDLWDPLLKDYRLPKWELPGHSPALSFGIGGAGTGVPFHFHGPVFAEVIYGSKQWFLYPYKDRPEFDPDKSTLQWYREDYPKLERMQRPLECLVRPGEVIYVPDKWWHATLNTETAMGGESDRVIALIDMDCFYVQVEQRLQPHLWGKPVVVAQNGILKDGPFVVLAVSYEARPFGIKRGRMFAEQVKTLCPDVNICYVPSGQHADKADLARYREASCEVFDVLNSFDSRITIERASIDEAFLDLTELVDYIINSETPSLKYSMSVDMFPTTHVANGRDVSSNKDVDWKYDREANLREWIAEACNQQGRPLRLAVAAEIVEQIRAKIEEATQFHCSAGIGRNKMIAKLVCSRHKPGQQTIIPDDSIMEIFRSARILSVRNLGGKLGHALMNAFSIETMFELSEVPIQQLNERFSAQAKWISNIAKGLDDEPVRARDKQTSIAVSKNFPGSSALTSTSELQSWLQGLIKELVKRLAEDQIKNERTARTLHVGCTSDLLYEGPTRGKSCRIVSYEPDALYNAAWAILRHYNKSTISDTWDPPIVNISLSASRFHDGIDQSSKHITEWINQKGEQLAAGKESEPPSQSTTSNALVEPNVISIDDASVSGMQDAFDTAQRMDADQNRRADPLEGNSDVGAQHTMDTFLPNSIEEIPSDLLASMPEDIRMELSMYYRQKAIQKGSHPASSRPKRNQRKSNKKRVTRTSTSAEPASKKKISDFFKKSS